MLSSLGGFAAADVHYFLQPEPAKHTFLVAIQWKADGDAAMVRIPAWSPGYYQIASYQDKIKGFEAHDDAGNALKVEHPDVRAWTVATQAGQAVHVSYRVTASDAALGFFGSHLGTKEGFINGPSAFMYIDGHMTEPDTLQVKAPSGWDLATSLDTNESGDYEAKSGYDELADAPLQFGAFHREKFTVEGIPFEAIFVPGAEKMACDPRAEVERLRRVSAPAIQMFGGAGFKHYTYIIHLAVGEFAGGLEHRASTCIAVPNEAHLNLDDLAAHENFHAWNVKQIRPAVLGPFDYTKPDRTGLLWWMEGVTDYYAKLVTYRSGLYGTDWLLAQIGEQIQELQGSNDRKSITLEEASRNCWEHGSFGFGDLSYYTKGLLVGLIFDAEIRSAKHGEKSLDDVIRLLFNRYRLPQPGMAEDGIKSAIAEVVGSNALDGLYDLMLRSTRDLPYDSLRKIGLSVVAPGPGQKVAVMFDPSADADAVAQRNAWLARKG